MKLRGAIVLVVLCAVACGPRQSEKDRLPAPRPEGAAGPESVQAVFIDQDRDNLLDITRGASVAWRSGEFNLEYSALHAIDSMSTTQWSTPPRGPEQSFIVALGAPARIDRLGALLATREPLIPSALRFEASPDGHTWREVFVFEARGQGGRQIRNVPPFDAAWLRISTVEPGLGDLTIPSILAFGSESPASPRPAASWGGCWTINGSPSRILVEDNRLRGVIGGERATAIDGAIEGNVARLMWVRGPMWGYAAMTIAPDGGTFSAVTFHEEILVGNAGGAWFGERCNSPSQIEAAPPVTFLQRSGRWSLFGLAFRPDHTLDAGASRRTIDLAIETIRSAPAGQRFRIVSREYRQDSPATNRTVSAARLASLREHLLTRGVDLSSIELVAAGSESATIEGPFAVMRLLASRIDLELVR